MRLIRIIATTAARLVAAIGYGWRIVVDLGMRTVVIVVVVVDALSH